MKPGWRIALGGFIFHTVLGIIYLWGNITLYVTSYLRKYNPHLEYHDTISIYSSSLVFTGVSMVCGGFIQLKIGYRKSILLGGYTMSLGALLSSFAKSLTIMIFTQGILYGSGYGIAYTAPIVCAIKEMPHRKSLLSGIIISGIGVGTFGLSWICFLVVNPRGESTSDSNSTDGYYSPDSSVVHNVPFMFRVLSLAYFMLTTISAFLVVPLDNSELLYVNCTAIYRRLFPMLLLYSKTKNDEFSLDLSSFPGYDNMNFSTSGASVNGGHVELKDLDYFPEDENVDTGISLAPMHVHEERGGKISTTHNQSVNMMGIRGVSRLSRSSNTHMEIKGDDDEGDSLGDVGDEEEGVGMNAMEAFRGKDENSKLSTDISNNHDRSTKTFQNVLITPSSTSSLSPIADIKSSESGNIASLNQDEDEDVIILFATSMPEHESGGGTHHSPPRVSHTSRLLCNHKAYVFALCFLLTGYSGIYISATFKVFGVEFYDNAALLSFVGSMAALCGTLGRIFWGYVGDIIGATRTLWLMNIFFCITLITYTQSLQYSAVTYTSSTCFIFFCEGGNFALYVPITIKLFGEEYASINYGIFFLLFSFGMVVAMTIMSYYEINLQLTSVILGVSDFVGLLGMYYLSTS
jgi:MFS family permease